MQLNLSSRVKSILELTRKYSEQKHIKALGTEYLILAMYETDDTLCHFLLNEYEITKEEIQEKTNDIFILRNSKDEYNQNLKTILNQAKLLAGEDKIKDEHLLMAILMNPNTIACSILRALDLEIDELIKDVKEIYDFDNNKEDLLFVTNLTKQIKEDGLTFVGRNNYLVHMDVILNRKYKNNPLLIGNAGVGKSALVEGYAKRLINDKSEMTILSLNLTAMLAGTRYRGDFEERFDKFIKEIATRKNVIIFIDEIHVIMGSATTEGNLDVANMLKPFLARNDIKVIGATTIEEYHKSIEKDKALARRFQPIFVSEPTIEETKEIIFGLKNDYENYHNVKITNDNLDYLIEESNKRIKGKYRPDKCLDILDDCMSYNHIAKANTITKQDIDKATHGYSKNHNSYCSTTYPKLNEYKWLYDIGLLEQKPLIKIKFIGDNQSLDSFLLELSHVFSIGYEELLEIDLASFKEGFMLSILIGSPPGYIGYEDEGILVKHVLAYPMSLLVFKHYEIANPSIKAFIMSLLSKGSFVDQRGRLIDLSSTIIVVEGIIEKEAIGYTKKQNQDNKLFDEIINVKDEANNCLNNKYTKALEKLNYEISFDFDVTEGNKELVNNYLYDLVNNKEVGEYKITKDVISK